VDIVDTAQTVAEAVYPGTYVWVAANGCFERVLEYPVVTGDGVFVNVTGGTQVGPLAVGCCVTVAVWG
jgi:hypothetical protein